MPDVHDATGGLYLILTAVLLVCACDGSAAQHSPIKPDTAFIELRRNILAAHATFDGVPLVDLRQTGACSAVIATDHGTMPLQWKDLGDLITRLQNGRTLFRIPANGRVHILSVPTGETSIDINTGLSLYDEECGGVSNAKS